MNYVSFRCDEALHSFVRDGQEIQAIHSDNAICEGAEFNLTELLDDDLPRLIECPFCMTKTLDENHVRACSGYRPPLSRDEIADAYSHPTEQAKRDILLRNE